MRQKLLPAQEDQIRSMRKDGRSPQEIVDFFKNTYQIEIPLWKISYIVGKVPKSAEAKSNPVKRAYHKKSKDTDVEVRLDDLVKILQQIDGGYKSLLRKIRSELIKSRAEVYDMMKGAGIEVEDDET